MRKIAIIGGGFSGMITAVQLIRQSVQPFEIHLFQNDKRNFLKGWTYQQWFRKQVLNVYTSRMSAFPDEPNHFLNWVLSTNEFKGVDRELVANSFMVRGFYGKYLAEVWEEAIKTAAEKGI